MLPSSRAGAPEPSAPLTWQTPGRGGGGQVLSISASPARGPPARSGVSTGRRCAHGPGRSLPQAVLGERGGSARMGPVGWGRWGGGGCSGNAGERPLRVSGGRHLAVTEVTDEDKRDLASGTGSAQLPPRPGVLAPRPGASFARSRRPASAPPARLPWGAARPGCTGGMWAQGPGAGELSSHGETRAPSAASCGR